MKNNLKKLFAVLLTVALVATMFVMPTSASYTNYSDFLSQSVVNGDFEAGVNGMMPYGWGLKSITNAANFESNPDIDYTKSYSFYTVEEDDNNVVELKKNGAGYVAMESKPVVVEGGKDYYINFDYKTTHTEFKNVEGCSLCKSVGVCSFARHWQGVVTLIRQYDKDGNLLHSSGKVYGEGEGQAYDVITRNGVNVPLTSDEYAQKIYAMSQEKALGKEVMSDYETASYKVSISENTASVVLYIGFGAYHQQTFATVRFDNIELNQVTDKGLFNGDFENTTYVADGGRTAGTAGPSGWYSFGFDGYGLGIGTEHSNAGATTYRLLSKTETDKNGNTNHYVEYSLIPTLIVGGSRADKDTKFYNYTRSSLTKVPVPAGKTFTVDFKFKSYTYDGSDTIVHGNYGNKTTLLVTFYDENGQHLAKALGGGATYRNKCQKLLSLTTTSAVSEWTEYTVDVTVPNESIKAAYYTVGFTQSVVRTQGFTGDTGTPAVNAVYCFDDVTVTYDETEESTYIANEIEEMSSDNTGYPRAGFDASWALRVVEDENRGKVYQVSGSNYAKSATNKNCTGYMTYWTNDLVSVTEGTKLKVSFDAKVDGYAEGIALQKSLDKYVNTTGANSYENTGIKQWALGEAPRISIRYLDANGEIIYAMNDGTVLTANGAVARVFGSSKEDHDWTNFSGTVTVPAGAVKLQYGFMAYGLNRVGSALAEHYYDNVVVKPVTDSYWTTVYPNKDNTDSMFMYFFGGDANGDNGEDIRDLVRLNNKLKDKTVEINADGDMNANGMWDNDDIQLLRWKLLGIDTTEKMSGNFNGTAAAVLKNKTILFCGDSITWNTGKSWAYKIPTLTGAVGTPAGVSGAAVSTIRPDNRIITQLHNHQNDYDYVVLHGGVNDAMSNGPIGEMSDSFDLADFDTSTYAGALEEMFYYAHEYYPNSKIGYIVNYAVPLSATDANGKLGNYFAVGKQICEKWNIPYIDLYSGIAPGTTVTYSDLLDVSNPDSIYFPSAGDVHTNEAGYDILSPYIAQWIAGLGNNADPR